MSELRVIHSVRSLKYSRVLLLLIFTFFLSSCSVPITCVLYNNTSEVVKVLQYDNSVVKESYEIRPKDSVKIREWKYYNYEVVSKNDTWRYDIPITHIPNIEFVETIGFGLWVKRIVLAQIESDGSIYLLRKNQKLPVSVFIKQPQGYPLIPIN